MNSQTETTLRKVAQGLLERAAEQAGDAVRNGVATEDEMLDRMADARTLFIDEARAQYDPAEDGNRELYAAEAFRVFDDVKNGWGEPRL